MASIATASSSAGWARRRFNPDLPMQFRAIFDFYWSVPIRLETGATHVTNSCEGYLKPSIGKQ